MKPRNYSRIVELPQGAIVFRGQSARRQLGYLGQKLVEFSHGRGVDIHPFPSDLYQCFGQFAIEAVEAVCFAADRLIAPA